MLDKKISDFDSKMGIFSLFEFDFQKAPQNQLGKNVTFEQNSLRRISPTFPKGGTDNAKNSDRLIYSQREQILEYIIKMTGLCICACKKI